jgi:alpha-tubulin suppressor-like RCC1 family protein
MAPLCGVTVDGTAYCWGENSDGQLGNGTTTSSIVPVKVAGQP